MASGLSLVAALLLQLGLSSLWPRDWTAQQSMGLPPDTTIVRVLSLGEHRGAAYGLALNAQSHDAQAGQSLSLRSLDLQATLRWLEAAQSLAPEQAYPLFLASRIYSELATPPVARQMLEFVERHFDRAPNQRWPWMAHSAYVARHVLGDDVLAARFAKSLREQATAADVPQWARDMEIFILAASNQLEAAQRLLGALLDSGQISDPRELEILTARLAEMKSKTAPVEAKSEVRLIVRDERSALKPERFPSASKAEQVRR